jgi:hypothetical protein
MPTTPRSQPMMTLSLPIAKENGSRPTELSNCLP